MLQCHTDIWEQSTEAEWQLCLLVWALCSMQRSQGYHESGIIATVFSCNVRMPCHLLCIYQAQSRHSLCRWGGRCNSSRLWWLCAKAYFYCWHPKFSFSRCKKCNGSGKAVDKAKVGYYISFFRSAISGLSRYTDSGPWREACWNALDKTCHIHLQGHKEAVEQFAFQCKCSGILVQHG